MQSELILGKIFLNFMMLVNRCPILLELLTLKVVLAKAIFDKPIKDVNVRLVIKPVTNKYEVNVYFFQLLLVAKAQ